MKALIVTLVLLGAQNLWAISDLKGIYEIDPTLFNCPICAMPEIEDIDKIDVIAINDESISLDLLQGNLRADTLIADATGAKGEYATHEGVVVQVLESSAQPRLQLRTAVEGRGTYKPVFTKK
tara:strand:+ start:16099 stop:16467 length:369 start_codon:yes stop_codon:yes gene_type:complete